MLKLGYPTLPCQHCEAHTSYRLNCEGGHSCRICYPKIDICMFLVWIARLVLIARLRGSFRFESNQFGWVFFRTLRTWVPSGRMELWGVQKQKSQFI